MLERAVMLAGVSDVVRLDVEPSQMLIYADEGLVEQVAVNLLKNAREAAEGLSDGRIEVVARISRTHAAACPPCRHNLYPFPPKSPTISSRPSSRPSPTGRGSD